MTIAKTKTFIQLVIALNGEKKKKKLNKKCMHSLKSKENTHWDLENAFCQVQNVWFAYNI
jgi:hypothetical protein